MKPENWYDISKATLKVSSKESKRPRQVVILRKEKGKKGRRSEGRDDLRSASWALGRRGGGGDRDRPIRLTLTDSLTPQAKHHSGKVLYLRLSRPQ